MSDNMKEIHICRICGYNDYPSEFWTEGGDPEFMICPCCKCESGYEDFNINAILKNREKWLENTDKKLEKQLKNIAPKYFLPKKG